MSTPSSLSITRAHAKLNLLEVLREPIAIIGTTVFPSLALLFFVVPQREIADERIAATGAAAQLAALGVMSVCLFTFGAGIAEDRARPFDTYVRTLAAGPFPQVIGRLRTGIILSVLGLIPICVIAFFLTEARLAPDRLLLTLGALLAGAVPMLLIGFAIGYWLRQKSAIAVAQLLFFGLAFGGGMFIPPDVFPSWLDTISGLLPSRAERDLVVWAVGSGDVAVRTVLVLIGWSVLGAAFTLWGFRRDEGRRFR
ncbi:ABC transporter permease [Aeromicrobium sp. YIM 150415]|uniref:ABC transporter permease n=1 Tax=Aeromicrobium piscarium TaxID=2590901 RepID=A0A554S837_9ACTN|nr:MULTISPECIES: ABC transporter permease [Aeromicrobium]MBM9465264.1 ABC transporter permease [Aeromicrobium sp. YIM 150415]TSD62528.1 ABC transporter permease [Aeromicrobium piscarium]